MVVVGYHSGGVPPILYIYSLRHFLTTKGALIDGDGYPPLPPLKWPQNDPFFDQKMTKFRHENESKSVILNGKIDILIKIEHNWQKITQKSLKIDQYLEYKNRSQFDYQKGG